jgi:hypothetical protein
MEQKKFEFNEINYDESVSMGTNSNNMDFQQSVMCQPIQECPQERVCHRYICYEVPHIMPCNTRIINHHIYKHTYKPCYTSCEENVCENIYEPKCC